MKKALSRREKADIKILARFVAVYCKEKHEEAKRPLLIGAEGLGKLVNGTELCGECERLLRYGIAMRRRCPRDPKPACKKCPSPCYRPGYRQSMRAVMRFSGMHLLKRGRIDFLLHYLF